MLIGYARTSTSNQKAGLEAQLAELAKTGVERVFSEQVSAVGQQRILQERSLSPGMAIRLSRSQCHGSRAGSLGQLRRRTYLCGFNSNLAGRIRGQFG